LIHPAIWPQKTWAENWGRLCPFLWGGDLCPHLMQYHYVARADAHLHSKWYLDPSNRLAIIHQLHKQTGQGNGPIA